MNSDQLLRHRRKQLNTPPPLANVPIWDVLRDEDRRYHALGFNAERPPPLFQATAPGAPDVSRPAIHTDRDTSAQLMAATLRTFPLPARDDEVELKRVAPFRTATSAIPRGLPPPPARKRATTPGAGQPRPGGVASTAANDVLVTASPSPLCESQVSTTSTAGNVHRFVAFGPMPVVPHKSVPKQRATPKPTPKRTKPLYVRMAERWAEMDATVFAGDTAKREAAQRARERRAQNRVDRSRLEDDERAARRVIEAESRKTLAAARSSCTEAILARASLERKAAEERELRRKTELERMRQEAAAEAIAARDKAVRERAEWLVELDRMKLTRVEQTSRTKLKDLENQAVAR